MRVTKQELRLGFLIFAGCFAVFYGADGILHRDVLRLVGAALMLFLAAHHIRNWIRQRE